MKQCLLIVFLSAGLYAQVSPQIQGAGPPSNPCAQGGQDYIDQTNKVLYHCSVPGQNWVNMGLGNQAASSINNIPIGSGITWGFPSDTGISRLGSASLAIGNGTQGDFTGSFKLTQNNAANFAAVLGAAITSNSILKSNASNQLINSDLSNPSSNVLNIGATGGVYQINADTGVSRDSTGGAGFFDIGNGTANDVTGTIQAQTLNIKKMAGGLVYIVGSYAGSYATVQSAATACAGVGGQIWDTVNTTESQVIIGNSSGTQPCGILGFPNVKLTVNGSGFYGLCGYDGTEIRGLGGATTGGGAIQYQISFNGFTGGVALGNCKQDGSQQTMSIYNTYLKFTGSSPYRAGLNLRGLFSGTVVEGNRFQCDLNAAGICVLDDNPEKSSTTITPSSATVNAGGNLVTVVTTASANAAPDTDFTWYVNDGSSAAQVVVSSCSQGGANGTFTVTGHTALNTFTYAVVGLTPGALTSCTYVVKNAAGGNNVATDTVHRYIGNIMTASHKAGVHLWEFLCNNGGTMGDMYLYGNEFDSSGTGIESLRIDGLGTAASSSAGCASNFEVLSSHGEVTSDAANDIIDCVDCKNVHVGGLHGYSGGRTMLAVSQTVTNGTEGIRADNFWTNGTFTNCLTDTVGSVGTVTSASLTNNCSGMDYAGPDVNNLYGFRSLQSMTVQTTSDWTCGTGGTNTSCVSAQTIGTPALSFTLPLVAHNWQFDCTGVVGQATGATANNWAVQTATNGATNTMAAYEMATAATAYTAGALTGQASGTSSVSIAPTWTLGGTGTKMPFHVHGTLEGASASGTVFNFQLVAPTVGDLVTIYRGATCKILP